MNRIIFVLTAFIGLALVIDVGSFEPRGRMCLAKMSVADTGRKMPAQRKFPKQERQYAIEVTDEALEELQKVHKHARGILQGEIFYKRR